MKLVTHVENGWIYHVYRNYAAALIYPFIFSFFFLSNFQTLNIFITLFSGTVGPRRLKLGTHMDSGQMYHIYWNQAAAAYSSLYFFIFLSLQFSNIEIFHHTFFRNCEARYTRGKWVDISCIPDLCCCSYSSLYFFHFSFSPIFKH